MKYDQDLCNNLCYNLKKSYLCKEQLNLRVRCALCNCFNQNRQLGVSIPFFCITGNFQKIQKNGGVGG